MLNSETHAPADAFQSAVSGSSTISGNAAIAPVIRTLASETAAENPAIRIGTPSSFAEHRRAFQLVYNEYLRCGYCEADSSEMRFNPLVLLAPSFTAVARVGRKVIGTGSTVFNPLGLLPSSHIFPDSFNNLLREGRKVAEGTMLACTDYEGVPGHVISRYLIRLGLKRSLALGVDDWCVVVNPKHVKFWHENLGLEVFSEERSCTHVKQHPGILMRLDLRAIRDGTTPQNTNLRMILEGPSVHDSAPPTYRLKEEEFALLLLNRCDEVASMSADQKALIRCFYPGALQLLESRAESATSALAA